MKTKRAYVWISLLLLIPGLILGGLFIVLDLDGFFGGMCAGAGAMFVVLAAYVFGRYGSGKHVQDSAEANDWLPSRERGVRE